MRFAHYSVNIWFFCSPDPTNRERPTFDWFRSQVSTSLCCRRLEEPYLHPDITASPSVSLSLQPGLGVYSEVHIPRTVSLCATLNSVQSSNCVFYTDGRRLVYIYGLCLLCVGSIGVALASSVHQLMFWRFFQTFGASPPLAVGAGVIGDIYRLEERGTAMGIFLMVSVKCIAPSP